MEIGFVMLGDRKWISFLTEQEREEGVIGEDGDHTNRPRKILLICDKILQELEFYED